MGNLFLGNAFASQDSNSDHLIERIEALENRIVMLEARHTFASFMPNFAERFHVMHRAGEAGDWAVASHELLEMKRLVKLSLAIDAKDGKLMEAMLNPNLEALEHAIEDSNHEKFEKALNQTIDTCNACHTATGSDFVQVKLDARDTLSMRHPHSFMPRKMPSGHAHGTSPDMSGMMETEPASDEHGDEELKPKKHDNADGHHN
jgi:phage shock protein A